jgi:pyridoxamine 5'-phosphate oxidase
MIHLMREGYGAWAAGGPGAQARREHAGTAPGVTDPAGLRRAYIRGQLSENSLAETWHQQLRTWFDAAAANPAIVEPNAIQLATVDAAGEPSVRTVLVKALDERGIVFYTSYDSAKAADLAARPRASAVFAWLAMERQVRLSGPVEKVSRAETEAYFASRPRGSQLGAWSSPQSTVVGSRAELEALVQATDRRFADGPVPAPPNWGGYLLRPDVVEFWQGRADRLHDRLRYRFDGSSWVTERLAP